MRRASGRKFSYLFLVAIEQGEFYTPGPEHNPAMTVGSQTSKDGSLKSTSLGINDGY